MRSPAETKFVTRCHRALIEKRKALARYPAAPDVVTALDDCDRARRFLPDLPQLIWQRTVYFRSRARQPKMRDDHRSAFDTRPTL